MESKKEFIFLFMLIISRNPHYIFREKCVLNNFSMWSTEVSEFDKSIWLVW